MIEPKNRGGGSHAGPPHSSVTAAANDQATVPTQSAEPVKPVVDESVNLKLAAEIEREANEIAERSHDRYFLVGRQLLEFASADIHRPGGR